MAGADEPRDEGVGRGLLIDRPDHFLGGLGIRTVSESADTKVMEMAIRPDLANPGGALHGGLIAMLVDVCAGSLAYFSADHENGDMTATTDLTVHYLSAVTVGPARAEARILRRGRSSFVLRVDVTDAGRDTDELAATSTIAFAVRPSRG
ncbi:MAG: PaaI family thioesterase [Acidimicrobiales bacterium]